MSQKVANGLDLQGQKITSVGTPTTGTDATNKTYVDGLLGTSALLDGGAPSTNHAGNLRIDFGSPT